MRKIKKELGSITHPVKHRPKVIATYSLEQVCDLLSGFLSGEIGIRTKKDADRGRIEKSRQP